MCTFSVSFVNFRCWFTTNSSKSLMTLDCGGIVGRYVSVIHPNKPLPLCEVQVYSTWEVSRNKVPQLPKPHGKQIIQFYEILLMQNSIQKRKGCHICR